MTRQESSRDFGEFDLGIRRGARVVAWTMACGVLLVTCTYFALVLINLRDEAPSADALALQRIASERPAVADADNAFVLMLGLAAPPGQDPLALGKVRHAFLETFDPSIHAADALVEFPGVDFDYRKSRTTATKAISDACTDGDAACADLMRKAPADVARWLADETWLLDRYRLLLARRHWRETHPTDMRAPFAKYQHAMEAQKLLFMQAWQHAHAGQGEEARELLRQDLEFWRMVLRSSDILITKMIANAAIRRHFAVGNLVLREVPDAAPPVGWDVPIDREERSMRRAFAGEWVYSGAALSRGLEETSEGSRLLLRPLFKQQATRNRHAARMVDLAEEMDVDFPRVAAALEATRSPPGEDTFRVYNPVGHIAHQLAQASGYADYAVRVSDLEGQRRAALLAVELRRGNAGEPVMHIRAAALRDPYTEDAFAWDAATRCIVFTGLASGARRYAYLL